MLAIEKRKQGWLFFVNFCIENKNDVKGKHFVLPGYIMTKDVLQIEHFLMPVFSIGMVT